MSKPAIALYLGESYATIGLFDISKKNKPECLFEKSAFLPQVSLKNLLTQVKQKSPDSFTQTENKIPVYIVTKYLDRLKQFRLGGSISQVILKGFENSYTLKDSRCLSLAAAQLIIAVDPKKLDEDFLKQEFERIKKINPDLNKVVISIPEGRLSSEQTELLHNFFTAAGLKIFTCVSAENQNQLRKTLLNAGSEGTKEEFVTDISEILSPLCEVKFFCRDTFESQFENCELFNSANNFLAKFLKKSKFNYGAYFDIEALKLITAHNTNEWNSPWGTIPIEHCNQVELSFHPFSELKLNHLSVLQAESESFQLEPGPVVAGRAIKPLALDLFFKELQQNEFANQIFGQLSQETLKLKIQNIFSVLEKGQKNPNLSISLEELKKIILQTIENEIQYHTQKEKTLFFGPLTEIFAPQNKQGTAYKFSWPHEIMNLALAQDAV